MILDMTRSVRTAIKRPGSGVTIDSKRLIRMREIKMLSRAQLAARMSEGDGDWKITPDAIAKIENGHRRPKTSTLSRLCTALGCEPEDLFPLPGTVSAQPAPASSVRVPCKHCGGLYTHDAGCQDAT
jgi:DNA-binding Xre family transcriptional regulator